MSNLIDLNWSVSVHLSRKWSAKAGTLLHVNGFPSTREPLLVSFGTMTKTFPIAVAGSCTSLVMDTLLEEVPMIAVFPKVALAMVRRMIGQILLVFELMMKPTKISDQSRVARSASFDLERKVATLVSQSL